MPEEWLDEDDLTGKCERCDKEGDTSVWRDHHGPPGMELCDDCLSKAVEEE